MIEAQLNYFDMAVIGIMLLSCIFAFFRGFVREILSFGAWVGAGFVTVFFFNDVSHLLEPYFKKPIIAAIMGTIGLYMAALIVFAIFNSYIIRILKSGSSLGVMDNLLGAIFGGLRGAFVVSLGYFLMVLAIGDKHQPEWMEHAITKPYAERGAVMLAELAPEYLDDVASMQEDAVEEVKSLRSAPIDGIRAYDEDAREVTIPGDDDRFSTTRQLLPSR